jgi:hypothetical protein
MTPSFNIAIEQIIGQAFDIENWKFRVSYMFGKLFSGILGQTHKSDVDLSLPWSTRAPKEQRNLLQVVKDFHELKRPAGYSCDMFAAKTRLDLNRQFALMLGDGFVKDWVGIELQKQTSSSGDTELFLMIGDEGNCVFVRNSQTDHPIKIDSAMSDVLARTRVKAPMVFSGQLAPGASGGLCVPSYLKTHFGLEGFEFSIRFDEIRLLL